MPFHLHTSIQTLSSADWKEIFSKIFYHFPDLNVCISIRAMQRGVTERFERAGLGKAPFRFTGYNRNVYIACQGAPAQPGGSCDYCGNAIMDECWLISADGKRFKVGTSCVEKLISDHGDSGRQAVLRRLRKELQAV